MWHFSYSRSLAQGTCTIIIKLFEIAIFQHLHIEYMSTHQFNIVSQENLGTSKCMQVQLCLFDCKKTLLVAAPSKEETLLCSWGLPGPWIKSIIGSWSPLDAFIFKWVTVCRHGTWYQARTKPQVREGHWCSPPPSFHPLLFAPLPSPIVLSISIITKARCCGVFSLCLPRLQGGVF